MGKSAKKVVGVAIAIAVPFVAPKIVGALAASSMVSGTALGAALGTTAGATVGGALVGAGLGAAGAAVTGGDVGRGALFGAIGGGVGTYGATTAAQAQQAAQAGLNADAAFMAADAQQLAAQGLSPTYAGQVMGGSQAAFDAAGLASQGLSAGAIQQNIVGTVGPTTGPVAGGATGTFTQPAATGGSFTQAMGNVGSEIAGRFTDPKNLADLTLRAGASLLTGQLAGDGLTEEEQQLLQAQMADLQALREQDEELFKTRLQEAMGLLGEARYFDPQQFGMQAQTAVKVAGAQQMREAERQAALSPGRGGMSAADRRRAGLDITARGQTAYAQGAESAQRQKLATYQAGLAALPTGGPTAGLQYSKGLMDMYGQAADRKRQVEEDIGGWFGSLTGTSKSASIG
jgi:osmotically inducible lipoprotein OsmB